MMSEQGLYSKSNLAEFDSDELLDRIEGDRELFKEVIKIFLDDTALIRKMPMPSRKRRTPLKDPVR